jgi:microcystin-dependent protein
MATPFVAEITMFAFNFAPKGWAFCAGQLLPISQNTALFSLLGTQYGGDGKATFGLPNLQGQAATCQGQSPGTSEYFVGQTGGVPNVTLLQSEIPSHGHGFMATTVTGTTITSNGNQLAKATSGGKQASYTGNYLSTASPQTSFGPQATSLTGSSLPHNNMQPYLTLNFCIALQGVFPARP